MIDYSAYPHIFDNIMCYADSHTLWAARNTCHDARKLADKLLVDVFSWAAIRKCDLLDIIWVENLLKERPNVELVIMQGQRPLVLATLIFDGIQSTIRKSHPDTHTVHLVNVSDAVKTGVLAVPIAYGGGPVLVKLSLSGCRDIDLDSVRDCCISGLELQTGADMKFYFLSPDTHNNVASCASDVEKPFIRSVVEQLAQGSQAQFNFVRSKHLKASESSKKLHALHEEIGAELGGFQDQGIIEDIWDRSRTQVHVLTFDELNSKVSPRVWEQVIGGPNTYSKDLVHVYG